MKEGHPPAASPIVEVPPSSPARRPLSARERLVCVPLGFLWLAILLVLAVPVCIYMTILYFMVRAARRLGGKGEATRNAGIVAVALFLTQVVAGGPAPPHVAASDRAMQIVLSRPEPESRGTGTVLASAGQG